MISMESKHFYSDAAIPIYILRNVCFGKIFFDFYEPEKFSLQATHM